MSRLLCWLHRVLVAVANPCDDTYPVRPWPAPGQYVPPDEPEYLPPLRNDE